MTLITGVTLGMSLRPVLVTGGNKGIGKAICHKLLELYDDVHVLLGSRNAQRGEDAVKDLIDALGEKICRNRLHYIVLDTSSDASIQMAVLQVDAILKLTQAPSLYAICNNAGVMHGTSWEEMLEVNYFGPQRVNNAFLPYLQRHGGRIVNISSGAAPYFVSSQCRDPELRLVLAEPWFLIDKGGIAALNAMVTQYETKQHEDRLEVYGFTKAAINAYTWLLAQQEKDLVIHSVNPGWIATDMTMGEGAPNPPSLGAIPPVYLLMDVSVASTPNGRYYGSDCLRSPYHEFRAPGSPAYDGPEGL